MRTRGHPTGSSFALVLRTYPFVLVRAAIYVGLAVAFVVAAGAGARLGWAVGAAAGALGRVPGAFWGAVAGIAFVAFMLRWLREYPLFLVKAGHVAAFVIERQGNPPAGGRGQIGQALGLVQTRYRGIGNLHAIERMVRGSLADLLREVDAAALLPVGWPPFTALNPVLRPLLGYLTEVLLAFPLRARTDNPHQKAADALVLFAQNHVTLLRHALPPVAIGFAAVVLAFFVALLPAASLAAAFPGDTAPVTLMIAAIFAWSFKQVLVDPILIAAILLSVVPATETAAPDVAWDARLTEISGHYRELKARAAPRAARRSTAA